MLWILGILVISAATFAAREQITVLSSWAQADGQVASSEIVRRFSPKNGAEYRIRVTLEFQADGVPHYAVASSSLASSDLATASRKVTAYPAGSHHRIYYDPANPVDMRFDAGYNLDYLAKPLIIASGGFLLVIAGTVVRFLTRRSRPAALR